MAAFRRPVLIFTGRRLPRRRGRGSYTIPNGGCGWPGGSVSFIGDFNAAQMIWFFFAAHTAR
jgi:hypothetical protein